MLTNEKVPLSLPKEYAHRNPVYELSTVIDVFGAIFARLSVTATEPLSFEGLNGSDLKMSECFACPVFSFMLCFDS